MDFFSPEILGALKDLGAVTWLGILSALYIRARKNGNINGLKTELKTIDDRLYQLAQDVAEIKGHLNIKD